MLCVFLPIRNFFSRSESRLSIPIKFSVGSRKSQAYEPLLLENEREAVADLLQYLESEYI